MKKQLGQEGFHATVVLLAILVVAVMGFAGWYVYNSQQDKKTSNSEQQQQNQEANATPIPTPTTLETADTVAQNELDLLRIFCQGTDPNTVVAGLEYIENSYGKFANCGVTDTEGIGGAMLISYFDNGNWTRIWAGNGIMDNALCAQYKIPTDIYEDCPGYYN